ncbi:BON domain-containing protein [Burkholderia ubonensis]|uniref:BON domain-containing protein n=1 Tax=Burkholderia ubonensis TaxID=101571 RepID=UPI00358FDC1A
MKSDATLKRDVEEALFWAPSVDARDIDVDVCDRIVTLRGTVASWPQKIAVQRAAQRIHGTRALVIKLEVVVPPCAHVD